MADVVQALRSGAASLEGGTPEALFCSKALTLAAEAAEAFREIGDGATVTAALGRLWDHVMHGDV